MNLFDGVVYFLQIVWICCAVASVGCAAEWLITRHCGPKQSDKTPAQK